MFERIALHVGHETVCVYYGNKENVAIECHDCNEILIDFDNPNNGKDS